MVVIMNVLKPLKDAANRAYNFIFKPKSPKERRHILLAFFLPFFILLFAYFVMGLYPFGTRSPLSYDLNAQYVHFFAGLKNIISSGGSLVWSWCRTLGGEFLGIIAYYLLSPFTLIILILPMSCIESAIMLTILCKTGAIGCTMYTYLRRGRGIGMNTSLIFSVCYALCSYSIVYGSNLMWLDELMILPLLTLGIEKLVRDKKYGLYVFSLSYALICNYYIGFMLCIFTAVYFFAYLFGKHAEEFADYEKRGDNIENCRVIGALIRIALFTVISIMISAFILLPAYRSLSFGKTDFTVPDFTPKQTADFLALLKKLLFGSYDTVDYDGLPFVYCGMLAVIFAPLYFVSKRIGKREKIANGLVLLVIAASTAITTLDIVWHGFQFPNCLNYRYSFIISFLLCVFAAQGFADRRSYPKHCIIGSCAGSALMIFCIQAQHYAPAGDFVCIWVSLGLLICYLAIVCLLDGSAKFSKFTASVLAVVVCGELFAASSVSMSDYKKDVGFASHGKLEDYLEKYSVIVDGIYQEDNGFYRLEKVGNKLLSDPMSLGMRGISGSTSTLNSAVIKLMNDVGYGGDSNFANYFSSLVVADSIFGIKYLISDELIDDGIYEIDVALTDMFCPEGVYIYKNPYALSIAYTANDAVISEDLDDYLTPFEALNALASSITGNELSIFKALSITAVKKSDVNTSNYDGHQGYSPIENVSRDYYYIEYNVKVNAGEAVYACFPSDYSSKATLYVNGEEVAEVDSLEGDSAFLLGTFDDTSIKVRVQWTEGEFSVKNGISYFYSLDSDELAAFYEKASSGEADITRHSDTKLSGTFTLAEGESVMFTTIPYDSDWSVYIDGSKVETSSALGSALLVIDLENTGITAGEHTIVFKYSSSSLKLGSAITLCGVFVLVGIYLWKNENFKRKLISKFKKKV